MMLLNVFFTSVKLAMAPPTMTSDIRQRADFVSQDFNCPIGRISSQYSA